MIKKVKLALLLLATTLCLAAAAVPMGAYADSKSEVCQGLGADPNCTVSGPGGGLSVDNAIKTTIDILSWVGGALAVIMVVLGGIKYVTSAGDSNKVTSAKNTVMYALIGLAIAALAQFLVRYVFTKATS